MTDLQTKMEQRAAELRTAIQALRHLQYKQNGIRPKGAPRMNLRPTGLLLQALTERYYKDDAGEAGDCVPHGAQ